MEVTVAQAGVTDARYTVRRICFASIIPINAQIIFIRNNTNIGYTISLKAVETSVSYTHLTLPTKLEV